MHSHLPSYPLDIRDAKRDVLCNGLGGLVGIVELDVVVHPCERLPFRLRRLTVGSFRKIRYSFDSDIPASRASRERGILSMLARIYSYVDWLVSMFRIVPFGVMWKFARRASSIVYRLVGRSPQRTRSFPFACLFLCLCG